jgi:hypothetical protein
MRYGAAQMRCDALAAQENLDGPGGDPRLDFLTDETMRDAVVVLGDLDVIIEIDAAALPLRILVGFLRQRQQRGMIELIEQLTPALPLAPQRAIIEIGQKTADRLVENCNRQEAAVPQPRQNPAADNLYAYLDFGFGESRQMQVVWERRRPERFGSRTLFIPFMAARSN